MKVILLFDEGSKVVGELLTAPPRKQRETQKEYERRFCTFVNESQPNAVHKVVDCHILRN